MKLSERLARLGTETAFEVLVRARALEAQGKSVIHLEIGEPDFDTPAHITEAAIEALKSGATHYGPSAGLPELRQAVAEDSSARRGVPATPEMVVVTPGGKPVMFYAILALIDPGDEVLYPNPGFPIYESMIKYIGGIPIPVRLLEDRAFELDVDQLVNRVGPEDAAHRHQLTPTTPPAAASRSRGCGPSPRWPSRHGIPVLSDEIYSELLYEGQHVSIASMPGMEPHAIILDGFSKTYAMTGWRLGYGIMPAPLVEVVAKLQTNAVSCTATFTQKAGVAALQGRQGARSRRCGPSSAAAATPSSPASARSPASLPAAEGSLLRLPQHRPHRLLVEDAGRPPPRRGGGGGASPAPPSASGARATSASATPTASRTSRRRCGGSGSSSRSRPASLRHATRGLPTRPYFGDTIRNSRVSDTTQTTVVDE